MTDLGPNFGKLARKVKKYLHAVSASNSFQDLGYVILAEALCQAFPSIGS